jgi:hypothetical protein
MTLSKQQVKALLDVLSKDDTRPVLEHALIDDYQGRMVLVATDSYKLVALNIGPLDGWPEHVGKFVSRDALTRWYKLAGNKDMLGAEELVEMATVDDDLAYPKWQNLLKERDPSGVGYTEQDLQPVPISKLSFNAKYALTLETVAAHVLTYELHGPLGAMIATTDNGLFILMPMKS